MKVVAFNGSARLDGNTAILLNTVLGELQREGIQTELVQLAKEHLQGCGACYRCFKEKDGQCSIDTDPVNEYVAKMAAADGILLGSPVYFADVTANAKALIERCGMVARANGDLYQRKVGAAVVAVRRGGAIHAFNSLNHFFTIGQMIVVGSSYWNIGIGREPGAVSSDDEGLRTMQQLGQNVAWALKKLNA
ncbi:MAG: flavodoxin family protein [Zetaproteobacteria bacterium]|nr:MAG: flavodoxin family protein [Zetaproteobacteria bacterium]